MATFFASEKVLPGVLRFDFTSQERNRLVSVHAGAGSVVRFPPLATPGCRAEAEDRQGENRGRWRGFTDILRAQVSAFDRENKTPLERGFVRLRARTRTLTT